MAVISEQVGEELERVPVRQAESALKRRLVDHLDLCKRHDETIRVTQVTPHHFRVNYLTLGLGKHSVMPMYSISKSCFFYVEERNGELVLEDQSRH